MPPYPSIQCKWSWIWPVYIDRCILGDPFSGYSILPGPVSNLGELKRRLAWRYYNTILFEKWNTDHIIWCSSCLKENINLRFPAASYIPEWELTLTQSLKRVWIGLPDQGPWIGPRLRKIFKFLVSVLKVLIFYLTWSLTKYAGLGLKLGRPWWLKERD